MLVLAALVPGAQQARAFDPSQPSLELVPNAGPAGSTILALGFGFVPGTSALLHFVQAPLDEIVGSASVRSDGTFEAEATVPESAVPGSAWVRATNDVEASAPFFVDASEPIGDGPGPPADKLAVCEVRIILESIRSRLLPQAGEDRLRIRTGGTTPFVKGKSGDKVLEVTVPRTGAGGDFTIVGKTVAQFTRPKQTFPLELSILSFVQVVNDPNELRPAAGIEFLRKDIACPSTNLFLFRNEKAVSIHTRSNVHKGFIDVTYSVIVTELRAE